jgi:hypothetical protein
MRFLDDFCFLKGDFLATNLFEFEGFGTALEVGHVPTL